MLKSLFVAATLISALIAAPALAGGHTWQVGTESFHVETQDLDLKTASGRAEALVRVERAAKRLCVRRAAVLDRDACQAGIVEAAARAPSAAPIRQALSERSAWAVADRK